MINGAPLNMSCLADFENADVVEKRQEIKCIVAPATRLCLLALALSQTQHHTRNTRALASVVWEEINSQTIKFIKGNGELYFITDNSNTEQQL